ncbi:hypothetical protein [Azoarcus sp. DN11]|uniref:hypothetical protein n=1 Tax=Azoarcus sp. DN11 TaxID=356837 RepID=UPI000EACD1CB|nr:hypothetical protein [Azoarcus sp. DN11]AYH43137.1 hypothetical protein CDA09_07015 [Azoarcus sp. DN11]
MQGNDRPHLGEESLDDLTSERLERTPLARGRRQQRAQLRAADMLSAREAATVSGIPARTLRRMRSGGQLLALSARSVMPGVRYPAWQFEPAVMQVLPNILMAFGKNRMWAARDFLTYSEPLLTGRVPLEEIRADRAADVLRILRAAADLGHGAY